MKFKILLFFALASSTYCFSQLKVYSGTEIYISGSDNLFSAEDIVNDGTITLGTGKLFVGGNIDNNATLILASGTLNVTGNKATQTFDFGTADVTKRLELDKTSGTATVNTGSLVITDGLLTTQGTIDGGGKLIMRSTATKTAIVEQSSGGTVNNIVVERYIPAKRAYRLLSSPVTTATTIKYNWQENQNNIATPYVNNSNTAPGYGTHIAGSLTGANGFDATQSGAASLFVFNNTTQAWAAISNTNTNTLTVGEPYRLMVRGSRAVDMNSNTATPSVTTLRTKGTLKIGTFINSNLSQVANGYSFIGNPYQAPVNMSGVLSSSANLNSSFYYVWDPKVGGTNGRGAYVTYTFAGNTNNVSGSAVNQYLQPMQSCFVKTVANGAASITFNETNKYTTATNENVYRTNTFQTNNNLASLRLTLYENTAFNQQQTPADGTLLFFDTANSNSVDANDAEKMPNLDENMSVFVDNSKLSIASFQFPQSTTIYPLNITQYRYSNYTLVAQLDNYNGLMPYIHDKLTQTYTEINPTVNYNFSVDATNAVSSASDRFEIVYSTTVLNTPDFTNESVALFPNPSSSNYFNLQLPLGVSNYNVKVYNTLGQLVAVELIETGSNTVNCKVAANLSAGIYQVVIAKDTTIVVKKWIKE
ncbi:MAG: hypothetical protein RL308_3558 [Bacteroidota bacterium]|jgi:hypothetical protein